MAIEPTTHPVLLFRVSALTANGHRIHYDELYTTQVEGFPGPVATARCRLMGPVCRR